MKGEGFTYRCTKTKRNGLTRYYGWKKLITIPGYHVDQSRTSEHYATKEEALEAAKKIILDI
jgi:hypothetical protein